MWRSTDLVWPIVRRYNLDIEVGASDGPRGLAFLTEFAAALHAAGADLFRRHWQLPGPRLDRGHLRAVRGRADRQGVAMGGRIIQAPLRIFCMIMRYTKRRLNGSTAQGAYG